jgi:alpha-tubulin suppressor-like RCC1 family protein
MPTRVFNPAPFVSTVLGSSNSCALTADGVAYCWGFSSFGQGGYFGPDTGGEQCAAAQVKMCALSPQRIPSDRPFEQLAVGYDFACGLAASAIMCWGRGVNLGFASNTAPQPLSLTHQYSTIVATSEGLCGLATDGQIYCFGFESYGELGDGHLSSVLRETPVLGTGFTTISAGGAHACAVSSSNDLYCWGHAPDGTAAAGDNGIPRPVVHP